MDIFQHTTIKVFGLILVLLLPTCLIYILLGEVVGKTELQGQLLGQTINFTGPVAFYTFMIIIFRTWATTEPGRALPVEINQEDLENMSEDDKTRSLYEINATIEILDRRRSALLSRTEEITELASVTALQVDPSDIQGGRG